MTLINFCGEILVLMIWQLLSKNFIGCKGVFYIMRPHLMKPISNLVYY